MAALEHPDSGESCLAAEHQENPRSSCANTGHDAILLSHGPVPQAYKVCHSDYVILMAKAIILCFTIGCVKYLLLTQNVFK